MIVCMIILVVSFLLDGILTNFLPFSVGDLSLFTPLTTIVAIVVLYPLFYKQEKKIQIEVTEYKTPETGTNRYKAEFKYKNLYYCLTGTMTREEMENILKNLYFMK